MSTSFVKRFTENENSTSITYRKYNEKPKDEYPTFSICFEGNLFHWYHDLHIYKALELTTVQYEMMLKGRPAFRYQYDSSTRLFRKMPTFMTNDSNDAYNGFHVQLFDFLLEANFAALDKTRSERFFAIDRGRSDKQPFSLSYHTPDMICFARDSTYVSNLIRKEDLLTFRRSLMESSMYKNTEIQVFIHHPGQSIRSLTNPIFSSSFLDYQKDKLLSFKMSYSTVIRKRSDYREPCSREIHDYDKYLMNKVINNAKCIPSYWKEIAQDIPEFTICTSQGQLQMIYENTTDWKSVMDQHDRPCIDMYNIAGWNWLEIEGTKKSDEIQIKFSYQDQYYQELEYFPDFDFETFISNIGGFVGIFLGYSMMQFPELLGKLSLISRFSITIIYIYIAKYISIFFAMYSF